MSENGNKAISASIEVELSLVEAELGKSIQNLSTLFYLSNFFSET